MLEIYPVETKEDIELVKELLGNYLVWREGEKSISAKELKAFQNQLANLPNGFVPPGGCLLLAKYDEKTAGCVALRKLSDDVCEMKRLYVKPQLRGLKIGRALAEAVIAQAKRIGYTRMRLDTVPSMQIAQALYASIGFKEIEPYRHNPIEGVKFIELKLV